MEFGPVQMLVLEFDRDRLRGEILDELKRLREQDIIRLVDLVVVAKDENGGVSALETSDLATEEAMEYGAVEARSSASAHREIVELRAEP